MDDRAREQWEKVIKRVESVTPPDGQAIVSLKIYICRGLPTVWTEPGVVKVEPKASEVIAALGA